MIYLCDFYYSELFSLQLGSLLHSFISRACSLVGFRYSSTIGLQKFQWITNSPLLNPWFKVSVMMTTTKYNENVLYMLSCLDVIHVSVGFVIYNYNNRDGSRSSILYFGEVRCRLDLWRLILVIYGYSAYLLILIFKIVVDAPRSKGRRKVEEK